MCGVGLIYSRSRSNSEREQIAEKMQLAIRHRGPDGFGVWSDHEGLSLFHRRLSILDLSTTGAQPMISSSERWIISFNGEIYNHQALRSLLEEKNVKLKGTSDTEVLLQLVELLGVAEAVRRCEGMFAIILWDRQNKEMYLIRDRIGEKPLYFGRVGTDFVVGSELKVFHSHPNFTADLDQLSVAAFFKYNYVPTPRSIFKNIHKVKPSHIYKFNLNNLENPTVDQFWSTPPYQTKTNNQQPTYESTKQQVKSLLLSAVERQMQADVPLGVFLSGGVDSSLICSLMTALRPRDVATFTIGFADQNYDESGYARQIAKHLGTRHTEHIVSAKDCLAVIEKIPEVYDEPFADSSQIPTYLLSKLTRQNVKVALSGDGGDEVFAGYNRYAWGPGIWSKTRRIPDFLRPSISQFGSNINSDRWNKILSGQKKIENLGTKLAKGLTLTKAKSIGEFHDMILSHWHEPDQLLISRSKFSLPTEENLPASELAAYMMWHDLHHYLPDDILVKVDRASMANSLETRAPFLDYKLIEYVTSSPPDLVRNPQAPKKIIKDILAEYVPANLTERPKMGFGIPINEWFRTELKELTLDLLSESHLKKQGLLDSQFVSQFAHAQLHQNLSQPYHLWSLLMFQLWHQKWA